MNTIQFTIPRRIESRNILDKLHWSRRDKIRKLWVREIFAANLKYGKNILREATGPMKCVIKSSRPRLLDKDNLIGGAKPLVDALKELRLIFDDSPQWLEVDYEQIQSKQDSTEIFFNKPGSGMKKKIEPEIFLFQTPMTPNFITSKYGHSVPVAEIADELLDAIGKAWTDAILKRAQQQRVAKLGEK